MIVFLRLTKQNLLHYVFHVCLSGHGRFSEHTKPDQFSWIMTPGFPNSPYTPDTFSQWQLRADPGNIIKLEFDSMILENNCSNDFLKIYDSLVALETRALEE